MYILFMKLYQKIYMKYEIYDRLERKLNSLMMAIQQSLLKLFKEKKVQVFGLVQGIIENAASELMEQITVQIIDMNLIGG